MSVYCPTPSNDYDHILHNSNSIDNSLIPTLDSDFRTSVSSMEYGQGEISVSYSNEICHNSILSNSPYRKCSRSASTTTEPRKVSFCPHVTARVFIDPGATQKFEEPTSPNRDSAEVPSKRPNLLIWKQRQAHFQATKFPESQCRQSEDLGDGIHNGFDISNSQLMKKLINRLNVFSMKKKQDVASSVFTFNENPIHHTLIGEYSN